MFYIITFFVIVMLVFINGFTDAPNAITTVVSTKVLSFKKAAMLSAVFNLIGIVVMSFINISVADCISNVVILQDGILGIAGLCSAMISVIIFSGISSMFGIPTSETHGLVAGLTGSAIALGSISSVNFNEWKSVCIGLIWSVLGTYILGIFIYKILKNILNKVSVNKIKKYQIFSSLGLSFMHGAQDGQKFIGVIILYMYILKGMKIPQSISILDNIWIVIFVSIIMFFGVSIGGRKIVENIGNNMVELNNTKGIISDITTVVNLLIASFCGLPVSTTHVKTISIIALGEGENVNKKSIFSIFKAWIWTFPVCLILSCIIAGVLKNVII